MARDLSGRLLRPQGARRTGRHALAARGADRRRHRAVAEDAHLRRVASAQERDRPDLLDVVARDRAAPAQDARLTVEDEEGLARVHLEAMEWRPARLDCREKGAPPLARLPCEHVRRQHRPCEVEDCRPHADRVGVLGRDHHALARGQVTGGREPALTLDVNEAGSAGAQGRPVRVLAELRQRDPEAVHTVEDTCALGELDRPAVDGELHGRLMIRRTRPGTPPARRALRRAPPARGRKARRPG